MFARAPSRQDEEWWLAKNKMIPLTAALVGRFRDRPEPGTWCPEELLSHLDHKDRSEKRQMKTLLPFKEAR